MKNLSLLQHSLYLENEATMDIQTEPSLDMPWRYFLASLVWPGISTRKVLLCGILLNDITIGSRKILLLEGQLMKTGVGIIIYTCDINSRDLWPKKCL